MSRFGTSYELRATSLFQNRLAPIIHHYFGPDLPPETAAACQRAYLTTAWRNAERLDELQRILALFAAHNIQVVLLKGVALVYTHYEKAALRPMCDLDLLLRPAYLPAAEALLTAGGMILDGQVDHRGNAASPR